MTGAKPINVAHSAKDETSRTSCILWACSQIGNFEFGAMRSVIGIPPVLVGDINTSGIFKVAGEASFDFEAPGSPNVNQHPCWRQFDPGNAAADSAFGDAAEFNAVNIDPTR